MQKENLGRLAFRMLQVAAMRAPESYGLLRVDMGTESKVYAGARDNDIRSILSLEEGAAALKLADSFFKGVNNETRAGIVRFLGIENETLRTAQRDLKKQRFPCIAKAIACGLNPIISAN